MSLAHKEAYTIYYDPNGLLVAQQMKDLKFLAGHIHTQESDGFLSVEKAVDLALEVNIDAIAISDHDRVAGSEKAREYVRNENLEKEIKILTGSEVSSADGHILAFGIQGDVASGMPASKTIAEIHGKDGVAIIPHIDLRHTSSISKKTAQTLYSSHDKEQHPDGLEVLNASGLAVHKAPFVGPVMFKEDSNAHVKAFHDDMPGAGAAFGGVDAHGRRLNHVLTAYKGEDPLEALRQKQTVVVFNHAEFSTRKNTEEMFFLVYSVAKYKFKNYKDKHGKQ